MKSMAWKAIDVSQRRKPPHPQQSDEEGRDPTDHHGRHEAEPSRRDARLEFAKLVGGADDHPFNPPTPAPAPTPSNSSANSDTMKYWESPKMTVATPNRPTPANIQRPT